MTLPQKTRLEALLEWGYKHHFIVPLLMRGSFKARTKNAPVLVNWNKGIKLLSIGNSHIDAAWLWRKEDTRKKKINVTFDRALLHMLMYPEFTYTQNQAVYYAWTKELYPRIWDGIKQRFKEGRWEVVGGDWVECDANIPSLESLVRQRAAGQRFYLEELGFVSEIAWADDVFGFPHCYPQILAKSGAKYFYTNKFCYNEVNKFPYHAMRWKSPDGSEVLLYWMQHKNSWARWLKTFRDLSVLLQPGASVELDYMADLDKARASFSDKVLPVIGNMFGHGDGGNGPKPAEIIEQLCWHHQGFTKLGTTAELFSMLEPFRQRLPTWNDELYLECHQGTLTSIHMIKENNRTAEALLRSIEILNVHHVLAGGKDYQPEINDLWKICLFNQFHDVLPGSSIPEVYRDAAREYQALFKRLYEIRDEIASTRPSAKASNTRVSITIINDQSWPRGGVVTVGLGALLGEEATRAGNLVFSVKDTEGRPYPCQLVSFPHHDANREWSARLGQVTGFDYQKNLDGNADLETFVHPLYKGYLWILVSREMAVREFGQRELIISWQEGPAEIGTGQNAMKDACTAGERITIENGAVSIHVDTQNANINGSMASDGTTIVKSAGITMYEDPQSKFDAWNIDPMYHEHPVAVPGVESVLMDNAGPVVTSILLKTRPSAAGTLFYHRVYLVTGQPIVYHDILVNWQENHKLLKYKVEPVFSADMVSCGMQVGAITRASVPKNRFTDYKAKYEYPVQQWASVEGCVDGKTARVTLLTRNKYGMFCKGSTMELSLLKSAHFERHTPAATLDPDDPRPQLIDRGFWRLSVATMIGNAQPGWVDSWRAGEEFNTPFSSLPCPNPSPLPFDFDFDFDGCDGSAIITAVKMLDTPPAGVNPHPEWFLHAKEGEARLPWLVCRLAEQEGKRPVVRMLAKPPFHVLDCVELDLLERVLGTTSNATPERTADGISIQLEPHEIKTIAVRLKMP